MKAEAETIVVPDDYPTIQEAINSAAWGDTVYVKKGIYHENLGINKPIFLVGEDIDTTIIDGNPPEGYRVPITIQCDDVSVSGFKLLYGYAGIQMWSVKNCNISGNRIAGGQHGIILGSSKSNNITRNIFESIGLSSAIQLSNSINNLVNRNYIYSCTEGIQIWQDSDKNRVSENTITNCKNHAISFQYSDNNIIIRNNISDSGCGTSIYVSNMNTISNNNYVNNIVQFSANEWYALTFGHNVSVNTINENYWNDYNGTDTDGNGIGDTPYIIDENNQDNYPLLNIIPEFPSWIILPLFLVATLFGIIIRKKFRGL
ncbi:MAG: right-handed parallel beta-helix repeat-containing protein [Candidatus Bathyarchaeum sp.]|nr:MAG: right-handed parallel beta-helix repeat-containing protein [Candidatus Bathyarchaeum sp.]